MAQKYRPIMVVGTGSHVGKSVLVMGLCRWLNRRGLAVAPFKAQNMALNSGITPEGGEIGRAQISQAEAAGIPAHPDMNPILLKPTSDMGSQVIILGKVAGNYRAVDYYKLKPKLTKTVMAAFRRLRDQHQVVVMEGAGSAAELNLKKHDLVNMSMAKRAGAAVILAADIDAGGVFAQTIGTVRLLPKSERELLAGIVINKFRGDPELFREGIGIIEQKSGVPVLGLLPHFAGRLTLPQEDGVALERGEMGTAPGSVRVGVVRLSHISNYTDADALAAEPGVEVRWISEPHQLAGLDLLLLPGSKSTISSLNGLRKNGLDQAIIAYHAAGGHVLGLCGGYQLLGLSVADPMGVEGPAGGVERGLGLLPVETVMAGEKTTSLVTARAAAGLPFTVAGELNGYEIHMGQTTAIEKDRPALVLEKRLERALDLPEGQVSPDGRVVGSYLHGLLDNDALRAAVLAWAVGRGALAAPSDYGAFKERQYNLLADLLEANLNLEGLLQTLPA